jgi:hypothetical protein
MGKLTPEDIILQHAALLTRASAVKARIEKMEFTTSVFAAEDEAAATAAATLYAALAMLNGHAVPLWAVSLLVAQFYRAAEDVQSEAVMELLRKAALAQMPTDGGVM